MQAEWASRGYAAEAGRLRQEVRCLQELSRAHRYDADAANSALQTAREHAAASARYVQDLEAELSQQTRRAERRRLRARKFRHEACEATGRAEEERVARLYAEDEMQKRRLEAKSLEANLACTGAFASKLSAELDQQRAAAHGFELEARGWAGLVADGRDGPRIAATNAGRAWPRSVVDGVALADANVDRALRRPCEVGIGSAVARRRSFARGAAQLGAETLESQIAQLPGCLDACVALRRFTRRHGKSTGVAASARSLTPPLAVASARRSGCSAGRPRASSSARHFAAGLSRPMSAR